GHPACVDAGKVSSFRIAANSENIAAKTGAVGDEGHRNPNQQRDQNWNGNAMHDEQAPFRDPDVVCLRVATPDTDWPRIGISNPDSTENERAGDRPQKCFGPDWPPRETETPALRTSVHQHENDGDTGHYADNPAPRGAD